MRKFKRYSEGTQLRVLLQCFCNTCSELAGEDAQFSKRRTDAYGIACQYGKTFGIKREDYTAIENMTLKQMKDIIVGKDKK